MNQGNVATPDELQKAINSITNAGASADDAMDVVSQVENSVGAAAAAPEMAAAEPAAVPVAAAPVAAAPVPESAIPEMEVAPIVPIESMKAQYGDPDLDKVKTMALSDLRPILEKVDLPPEKKFMIYKDILELTEDKACIEPAYNSAKKIADDKARGEALVFIVECIDRLGIQMAVEDKR